MRRDPMHVGGALGPTAVVTAAVVAALNLVLAVGHLVGLAAGSGLDPDGSTVARFLARAGVHVVLAAVVIAMAVATWRRHGRRLAVVTLAGSVVIAAAALTVVPGLWARPV